MALEQLPELILQSLEDERGGIQIFETALKCIVHEDLRSVWKNYLDQTCKRERIQLELGSGLGIDPETQTPARAAVKQTCVSHVEAMQTVLAAGDPNYAELVAYDCVVLTETKTQSDWEQLARSVDRLSGAEPSALKAAVEKVESQDVERPALLADRCRELWFKVCGIGAVLTAPARGGMSDSGYR
jgi:hypothetical protein